MINTCAHLDKYCIPTAAVSFHFMEWCLDCGAIQLITYPVMPISPHATLITNQWESPRQVIMKRKRKNHD